MAAYTPPPILVRTWLQLLSLDSEKEARVHAKKMIEVNFGNVDLALIYLEQNQLPKRKLVC